MVRPPTLSNQHERDFSRVLRGLQADPEACHSTSEMTKSPANTRDFEYWSCSRGFSSQRSAPNFVIFRSQTDT